MSAGKSEVVFLERITPSGGRKWQRAKLLLDPVAGLLTFRYREGLGKQRTLEWQASQIESFQVEMHPNPHSSLYERAFLILLMLLLANLAARFNLEDTFLEALGEAALFLFGVGLAAGVSFLVKAPVIQVKVPDAAPQHSVYGPVQQALRERLQRDLEKEGKAVTETELDTLMTGGEGLPEPMQKTLFKVRGVITTLDPDTFRLHGARWGSIKKTRSLVQRLEQTLIEHRVADMMPGQWHDLPWQRSRIISTFSRLVALLIVLGGLAYFIWPLLDF